MAFRALTDVLLGLSQPAHAGDILPAHYPDMNGNPTPLDFDSLVAAGSAEKIEPEPAKPAKRARKANA